KTPSQKALIGNLSGGNQQKVIIGRWLLTDADIYLLDEPTRGIDVGAKFEIYQIILNLAAEGKSILMVSSELPELLGVCDRILVMSNGRVAGVEEVENLDQEKIMTAEEIIEDLAATRDVLSAKIMDLVTLRPSEVNQIFWEDYQTNPKLATDNFFEMSKRNNYIKTREIAQNIAFTYNHEEYGEIQITINLSKPEKDPKEIALALENK